MYRTPSRLTESVCRLGGARSPPSVSKVSSKRLPTSLIPAFASTTSKVPKCLVPFSNNESTLDHDDTSHLWKYARLCKMVSIDTDHGHWSSTYSPSSALSFSPSASSQSPSMRFAPFSRTKVNLGAPFKFEDTGKIKKTITIQHHQVKGLESLKLTMCKIGCCSTNTCRASCQ